MLRQRRPFFLSRGFWRALQIAFPWTLPFTFVFLPDICLLQRFYTLQFLSANLKSSHNMFWLILYLKNLALTNKQRDNNNTDTHIDTKIKSQEVILII